MFVVANEAIINIGDGVAAFADDMVMMWSLGPFIYSATVLPSRLGN